LFILANTLVTTAVGYLFWLVAAHLYSASVVGLTVAITSASGIVVTFAYVGVGGALIQSLPEQSKETGWSTTFWAGMATVVFFAVALSGIALMVLPLFSPKLIVLRSADYASVFAIATVALAAGNTIDWTWIAERRAVNLFSRNSAAGAVRLILLGLLGLAAGSGALRLLGAWVGASVFGLVLGAALLVRQGGVARPPGLSVLLRTARRYRSRVTGYQLIGLGPVLMPYLLALIVTERLSTSDNAYFFTAWTLASPILIVAPAVSLSLFAEAVHRPDEVGAMARSAFKIIGAILLPSLVAILAVGGTLLSTFGAAYADHGVGVLRLTVLASIPGAVNSVYMSILQARGRLTSVVLMYLGISFGTVGISWLLLPMLGINAVGWVYLALHLCGCVVVVLDIRRQTSHKRLTGS
jgi:O-antigen/teichoic acid export membrane protein